MAICYVGLNSKSHYRTKSLCANAREHFVIFGVGLSTFHKSTNALGGMRNDIK